MKNTYYAIYEAIGNFSHMVYVSDNFDAIQDYLQNRFINSNYDYDSEENEQLFYSYFSVEEI